MQERQQQAELDQREAELQLKLVAQARQRAIQQQRAEQLECRARGAGGRRCLGARTNAHASSPVPPSTPLTHALARAQATTGGTLLAWAPTPSRSRECVSPPPHHRQQRRQHENGGGLLRAAAPMCGGPSPTHPTSTPTTPTPCAAGTALPSWCTAAGRCWAWLGCWRRRCCAPRCGGTLPACPRTCPALSLAARSTWVSAWGGGYVRAGCVLVRVRA